MLKIINNGLVNQGRKGGLPSKIAGDKNFTFGIKSDLDLQNMDSPGLVRRDKGTSSMN